MNRNRYPLLWLLMSAALSSGCDGNDLPIFGPADQTQQKILSGRFLDSAVTNLDYHTPSRSGTTDSRGRFEFQQGETVTFAIGGVTLGGAEGQAIVTPVNLDLTTTASTTTPWVQNIARFLLALDQDGNPGNGIMISDAVKTAAKGWSAVDFTSADFDTEIADILASAGTADGRSATLPANGEAREHLENSIYCSYGGAFSGNYSFSSGSSGQWILSVDPQDGGIGGFLIDNSGNNYLLNGKLNPDSSSSFTATADGAPSDAIPPWDGVITASGVMTANNGAIEGQKRYLELPAGTSGDIYQGYVAKGDLQIITDVYAITFAIDGSNFTGTAFSLLNQKYSNLQLVSISGNTIQFSLDGTLLLGGGLGAGNDINIANGDENMRGTVCRVQ